MYRCGHEALPPVGVATPACMPHAYRTVMSFIIIINAHPCMVYVTSQPSTENKTKGKFNKGKDEKRWETLKQDNTKIITSTTRYIWIRCTLHDNVCEEEERASKSKDVYDNVNIISVYYNRCLYKECLIVGVWRAKGMLG